MIILSYVPIHIIIDALLDTGTLFISHIFWITFSIHFTSCFWYLLSCNHVPMFYILTILGWFILLCCVNTKGKPSQLCSLYVCPILLSELWPYISGRYQLCLLSFFFFFFFPTLTTSMPFIHKIGLFNLAFSAINIDLLAFCFKWKKYVSQWEDS